MACCCTTECYYSERMMRPSRISLIVTSALMVTVILGLVGCGTQPGSKAPSTATPSGSKPLSASPGPMPVASIQVNGAALILIGSNASHLQQIAYRSDPVAAVASLSRAIRETPAVETLVATQCSATQKRLSWGDGLTITYSTEIVAGVANSFVVRSDSAHTPGGVKVTAPAGFSVGDPISELIAATPGIRVVGQDTVAQFGLRAYFDLDANEVGGVAISDAKTGLIRLLNAPVGVSQDC